MDDLNQIEEDLKKSDQKDQKGKHKVSGRSVFKLKEIMQSKNEEKTADDKKNSLEYQD